MSLVERAARDLLGSEVKRIEGRGPWMPHLAEMLLLCNEASKRCAQGTCMLQFCMVAFFACVWLGGTGGPSHTDWNNCRVQSPHRFPLSGLALYANGARLALLPLFAPLHTQQAAGAQPLAAGQQAPEP